MKKIVLIMLFMFGAAFADCVLISSPYPKVEEIKDSSFYAKHYYNSYKDTDGELKFREFSDAYITFVNALSDNAIDYCKKKGYNGIYNVQINHTVVKNSYFFSASVDYVQTKKVSKK